MLLKRPGNQQNAVTIFPRTLGFSFGSGVKVGINHVPEASVSLFSETNSLKLLDGISESYQSLRIWAGWMLHPLLAQLWSILEC